MGTFTERIRLVFDVDSKGAQTGFGGFARSVREAEGISGKFKAGIGSLSASLKQNLGPAALGAAAALVTFAAKAVSAFTDTAKAALDLAKATGLSTEQASRWIAVGDDMGVTADQLASGIGKIAKTLDSGKWDKYGIATRDASGQARDANEVLLDALDLLARTGNATERARIGNELFGKGYTNLAPLIGKTRNELAKYLGEVEEGQVITDSEARKAEKMRLAWDKVTDALDDLTLAIGETLTALAPLIDKVAEFLGVINGGIDGLPFLNEKMQELADAAAEANSELVPFNVVLDTTERAFAAVAEVAGDAQQAWEDFSGSLSDKENLNDAKLAVLGLAGQLERIASDKSLSPEQMWLEAENAIINVQQEVAAYLQDVLGLPAEQVTEIVADITPENAAAVVAELDALAAARKVPYVPVMGSIRGSMAGESARGYASGTSSAAPGVALVGENGPELVNFRGGESVLPAGQTRAALSGGDTYNVTVQTLKADADIGRVIQDALNALNRRGG